VTGPKTIITDVELGSNPLRGVQFLIDEVNFGAEIPANSTNTYQMPWDTTQTSNGLHVIRANATDTMGLVGTATLQVNVQNTPPNVPPTITIRTPIAGSTVTGKTTVQASAADVDGIANMTLVIGGSQRVSTSAPSISYNWNTAPDKKYSPTTITVSSRDKLGNATSKSIVVGIR